jgi:hypothetical protein
LHNEGEHLRGRIAAVVRTFFWQKLLDARKIVAIKQWREKPVSVSSTDM